MSPLTYKSLTLFAFSCGGGGQWGIVSPVSPCFTIRSRKVQPLVALYPTVRLSPWRQVRKNIHSRVWTPGHTWSVLHQGGPPLLVPLSPSWLRDMGLTPRDWSGPLSRVTTPGITRSCLPQGGLLSWSPRVSLPPEVAHYLLCIFYVTSCLEPQCKTTAKWKTLLSPSLW